MGSDGLLLGNHLGISQQLVRNCTVHYLFCIFFYHYYNFLFLFSPIKMSLSQPTNFAFFDNSLPHPTGLERANGCVVFGCLIKLKHLFP